MKGRVIKSTGSWYQVVDEHGKNVLCRTRGKLRLSDSQETNPVAVGDMVVFEDEAGNGVITEVLPRKNHMLRQSVKKSSQRQALAANVDQVLLLATVREPRTSLGFIDRFIVSAESFRIPQVLLFNKVDLLDERDIEYQNQLIDLYTHLGIRSESISAINDDLKMLDSIFTGKITLVAGHSGVGKSTFLNKLSPAITQQTGEISDFSNKGTHTTTFAEMFPIGNDSFVIDTPGVKEWGLVEMEPQEISDYFVEMRELRLSCKFGARCLHISEPKCRVLEALTVGAIAQSRYESYVSMVMNKENRK